MDSKLSASTRYDFFLNYRGIKRVLRVQSARSTTRHSIDLFHESETEQNLILQNVVQSLIRRRTTVEEDILADMSDEDYILHMSEDDDEEDYAIRGFVPEAFRDGVHFGDSDREETYYGPTGRLHDSDEGSWEGENEDADVDADVERDSEEANVNVDNESDDGDSDNSSDDNNDDNDDEDDIDDDNDEESIHGYTQNRHGGTGTQTQFRIVNDAGFSDLDDGSSVFGVGSEEVDFITANDENMDADLFYMNRRESFGTITSTARTSQESFEDSDDEMSLICNDANMEYKSYEINGDRSSYSSNERMPFHNTLLSDTTKFPTNSQTAYTKWDSHDKITMDEIVRNNGIYEEFHPDLNTIETSDPSKIVKRSPGEKFRDSINLKHVKIKKLYLESVKDYKNNVSSIITDSQGDDYLVIASNSELAFFELDRVTHVPNGKAVLKFDTRPLSTSTTDRLISTWPHFPHTINYLKTFDHFMGRQVLGACVDDSTLMIWFSDTIIEYIIKFRLSKKKTESNPDDLYQDNNRFYGLKINADFKIKMESSLWGLDFLNYEDDYGIEHNLIVASDNSQSITLIYFDAREEQFYHVKSHQILHNIPEVSFINFTIRNDGKHVVKVACASISAELIVFKFKFRINQGPLNRWEFEFHQKGLMYYIDPAMAQLDNLNSETNIYDSLEYRRFHRVTFSTPHVITRALLSEDCWTVKPISSKYFHPVPSVKAVFGDPSLDEGEQIKHITNESTILDLMFDPVKTSHLGMAASWQFFESRTTSFAQPSGHHETSLESAKFTGVDDEYRRINKGLSRTYRKIVKRKGMHSLNSHEYRLDESVDQLPVDFLAVSTSKRLGLFRLDTLYCNAATKRVFDLPIPHNDKTKFSNRISISCVIPELSCFVALTQQGLVTIMRLCCHRGVYGMRQEHIFPNALSMALGYHDYRTIAGMAVRDRSPSKEHPRFLLYLVYTDGLVVMYEMTTNQNQDLILSDI